MQLSTGILLFMLIIKKNYTILTADLNNSEDISNLAKTVTDILGTRGLDVLVNNAGISSKFTRLPMVKEKDLTDHFRVNVIAPILLAKVRTNEVLVQKKLNIEIIILFFFSDEKNQIRNYYIFSNHLWHYFSAPHSSFEEWKEWRWKFWYYSEYKFSTGFNTRKHDWRILSLPNK